MTVEPIQPAPSPPRDRTGLVLIFAAIGFAAWCASFLPLSLVSLTCFALILTCLLGLISTARTGNRPVSIIFLVFVVSWLAIAPTYQIAHGELAWNDTVGLTDANRVEAALLLTLGFVLCFVVVNRPRRLAAPRPDLRGAPQVKTTVIVAYLGLLVALSPFVIASNGGLSTLFASRDERDLQLSLQGLSIDQSGGVRLAIVAILPSALATAVAVLIALRLRHRWDTGQLRRAPLSEFALAFGALVAVVLYDNPFSNTRFVTTAAAAAVVLALMAPRSRRSAAVTVAIAFTGCLIAYPLANAFRLGSQTSTVLSPTGLAVFAGPDFDGFQQVMNSLVFVADKGYSFGHYITSALAYPLPRSLWQGKAMPASIDVASHASYQFTNLSLPIDAEFFLEFGIPGVVLCGCLLGWIARKLDDAWLRAPASRLAGVTPYIAPAMLGIIRGPLGSLAPVWGTTMVLIVLGLRKNVPRRGPANGPAPEPASLRTATDRPALVAG